MKRASFRLGRPVNLYEIKKEVEIDSNLEPISNAPYHALLSDAAKNRKNSSTNKRLYRIGRFQRNTYYYFENDPKAESFIKFRLLEQKWNSLKAIEEISRIETCLLPSLAAGRIKLLDIETKHILKELKALLSSKIVGISKNEIDSFIKCISKTKLRIKNWIKDRGDIFIGLPQDVQNTVKGWTVHELKEFISPFYHRAARIKTNTPLQSLIGDSIRRIPNSNFKQINSKDTSLAAQFLYDEIDALIFIAKEWGGVESRYHATVAHNEIGLLRDPRFIIPALNSKDFNFRLSAISCLAFLPCEDGNKKLFQLATDDMDIGVRQSALWAYGFIQKEKAIPFIKNRNFQDEDVRVRNFARKLVENHSEGWLSF